MVVYDAAKQPSARQPGLLKVSQGGLMYKAFGWVSFLAGLLGNSRPRTWRLLHVQDHTMCRV